MTRREKFVYEIIINTRNIFVVKPTTDLLCAFLSRTPIAIPKIDYGIPQTIELKPKYDKSVVKFTWIHRWDQNLNQRHLRT